MMKKSLALLPLIVIAVLTTAEVIASSVGGGIYVPVTAVRNSTECPTGNCRNGATCSHCARLGFACVDGATEAPCTANGGCYPNRPTFGHYKQKWRTWPGEPDPSGPSPTVSEEDESLLKSYDAPPAEEEDEQAPPPIEDSIDDSGEEIPSVLPAVEIELPPLPRSAPERPSLPQQPAPNFRQPNDGQPNQQPPAPPFGLIKPSEPAEVLPSEFSANDKATESVNKESVNYASPASYIPSAKGPSDVREIRKNQVKHVGEIPSVKRNTPPALPASFTQAGPYLRTTPMLRRLPVTPQHRLDNAVQPAAAFE